MRALVRGLGNIGTTLANLLLAHRGVLGIDEVSVLKRSVAPHTAPDVEHLRERGATVYVGPESGARALSRADYVFDTRAAGAPRAEFAHYRTLTHLLGVSAQGTEDGFGAPFVSGVNDAVVRGARFVQIASCNTHGVATLSRAFAGDRLADLVDGDFVVARRAEDVGNHDRLVSGTVVARHRDPIAGTHHAVDARRVFATVDLAPSLTSSDVTTPSQLFHTVRFSFRLARPMSIDAAVACVDRAPYLARSDKFDASRLFELGRRYGAQGRIYAHAIVVTNNLLASGDLLRGWAFVPQEGNTILSTLDAFLLQTEHAARDAVLAELRRALLRDVW